MNQPRSTNAVHARCVTCGLRMTGVMRRGVIYASDKSRPEMGSPEIKIVCAACGDKPTACEPMGRAGK